MQRWVIIERFGFCVVELRVHSQGYSQFADSANHVSFFSRRSL